MRARFEVHRAFPVEERALFVVSGAIQRGMVQVGMTARLEGDEETFARRVHGVEFLDVPPDVMDDEPDVTASGEAVPEPGAGTADVAPEVEADRDAGVHGPCLTFYCRDGARLEEWLSLDWEGRALELSW